MALRPLSERACHLVIAFVSAHPDEGAALTEPGALPPAITALIVSCVFYEAMLQRRAREKKG